MATLKDLLDEQERQKQLLAMMAMGGDERALGNYPPPPVQQPSQGNYSDMFDPSIPLPPARQYTGNTLADIARNPDPNWSQETKDALARRADLSGTLRVSHNGNDVSGLFGGSGNQPQQPTFRNTLQVGNNAPVDLGQSQTAGLSADWARPVDVMGAKGHWASDNSGRIILRDGRIVDPGRDTGEERKRRLADAEIAKREAEVRNLNERPKETGTWSTVESNGKQYLINNKTGAIKPAEVGGEQLQGKKGDGAKLKEEGAADVNVSIAALRDAYNRLDSGGGITNTDKGWVDNSIAGIASSGVGQATGKIFGTQNQSARNDIAMTRPALLAALMKSTGMSAKQMDSNVELKLWLSTATDPTLDVQSNRRALDKIEMKYLGGDKIGDTKPTEPKQPSQEIVERGTSKSGKPMVKRKGSKDWEYE